MTETVRRLTVRGVRPLAVIIIGCLLIAAGTVGLAYHATEFRGWRPFQYDVLWVCLIRLAAIVGGVFMLRGKNWARWGVIVWMAYHVVLSAFHSLSQFLLHGVFLAVIAGCLLHPHVDHYFQASKHQRVEV